MKILVVDDDENLRRLVAAYLESEGYEVEEAADGPSALAGCGEGRAATGRARPHVAGR